MYYKTVVMMGLRLFTAFYFILFILTDFLVGSSQEVLPEPFFCDSACYSSGISDYSTIHSECIDPDSVIAVSAVKAVTKPTSQNCSQVLSTTDYNFYNRCCVVDATKDCKVLYRNIVNDSYTYEAQRICTGHHKCPQSIRVQRMVVSSYCDNQIFPSENNYMKMDYFCIKKSKIAELSAAGDTVRNFGSLYIQSKEYPDFSHHSNGDLVCKISVTNETEPVQIVAIDIQLVGTANVSFHNLENCSAVKRLTHQDNNRYRIRKCFTMEQTFNVLYQSESRGRFWVGIISNQTLAVTCGKASEGRCRSENSPTTTSPETSIESSQPILPDPLSNDSACYASGITNYSTINSQCGAPDSVIAVLSVQAATKPTSQNCSEVLSAPGYSFFSRCCIVDIDIDCNVTYNNTANQTYTYAIQNACTGYNKCPAPVRVQRMEVSAVCDNTVFPSYNNFMAVDYFCIKKCKIMDMGSTSKRKEGNHSVYLQSNGYPGVFHHFNFDEWCEIDGTNAMETVHVVSIDVQLSGSATIAFKDTETCRDVKNITLLNNNKYQIKKVFDLKNKFFISYKANTMGRFWIGFVSPQKLTITCGLTIGENCTVGHLPDDSSMSTESSALSSDILGTNSSPSPPWWIAVIVALLVGVVIAVVVYKRQKRKQKVSDENGNTDTDPGDIFVITPSERNLIPPSKTNIDIFIPEKRNNALPKLDDSAGNENLSTERKKKKKKRKKKTKHRNVDDENHSKQEDC